MKLFEEFENDLRDVNSVKELFKVMLANGVRGIDANDFVIQITERCLVENVPQQFWNVEMNSRLDAWIYVYQNNDKFICYVSNKEAFTERTGFEFPEVEE